MDDVHPPIYQILLKFWIIAFGADEVATRLLSWTFSAATLYLAFKATKKHGELFATCVLLIIASNGYFAFYGNEVRSYSMLMFCSTLILFTTPTEKSRSISNIFLLSCLLASWVHYFGLLIAAVTLLYCLIFMAEGAQARIKVMSTGLVMIIWPLHHITNGSVIGKSGGDFWIESGGFIDTMRFASSAVIPKDLPYSGFIFICLMLCLFFGLLYISAQKNSSHMPSTKLGIQAFAVWAGLILIVGLIDRHTPMSTGRNFIVTVPFFAVSVASVVKGISTTHLRGSMALMVFLTVCCAFLLTKSFEEVSRKSQSAEDWRGATQVALENSSGRDFYVVEWGGGITDHYVRKFSSDEQVVNIYKVGKTKIIRPAVIMFARLPKKTVDSFLIDMNDVNALRIFPKENSKDGGRVGVYTGRIQK